MLTVAGVVWRPRGLDPAWVAVLGAVAALLVGAVHLSDLPALWNATWNATLTLVALIVLSLLLDAAGLFRWTALHVARWGGGSGRRLLTLLILFSALVTALFANDGGVLILTPLVLELAALLALSRAATLACALAVGFVVDAASLPFTISNLTNIIAADAYRLNFAAYARVMVPVNLAVVLACVGVLLALYGHTLPGATTSPRCRTPPRRCGRGACFGRAGRSRRCCWRARFWRGGCMCRSRQWWARRPSRCGWSRPAVDT